MQMQPIESLNDLIKLPSFVQTLGDPHLARKFNTGVPTHRKGEREEMVKDTFAGIVNSPGYKLHVCMGDLFDKFRVPEEDILFAADVYRFAASNYPDRQFVIIRGNHDASRDTQFKSSFDVFTQLVAHVPNIHVVAESALKLTIEKENFVFYPWHPFKTAKEIAAEIKPPVGYFAFGHWDILAFSEDSSATDNLIPFEEMQTALAVITGHYHTPRIFMEGDTPVWVTGSMQPYSHAEDPNNQLYITLSLQEATEALEADPERFKNMNLRITLLPTEAPIAEVDCLSLTFKRVSDSNDDDELEVNLDSFDLEGIFKSTMVEHNVSTETTNQLWGQFMDLSAEAE